MIEVVLTSSLNPEIGTNDQDSLKKGRIVKLYNFNLSFLK